MRPGKCLIYISLFLSYNICIGQIPTYEQDIKPILQKNCVSCHRSGEVGAMPFVTYEDVASYGKMIQYTTSAHLMPPWYADPSYRHFSNERVLSDDDIQKIKDWVTHGMQEGLPSNTESGKLERESTTSRNPDLVVPMREPFEQYGIYLDQYQVFVLPTHLEEDRWVDGIEFVPGNKKIVRSAVISVVQSDKFDVSDKWDPRYGYYSFGGLGIIPDEPFWYTWSLQQGVTFFPQGTAKFLPKNSKLILHIQYGPTGRPLTDSSFVRLYFAKNNITRQISSAPLINPYCITNDSLFIPANSKKIFHASYTIPFDLEILSLTPQANLICRSWEVYAMTPGNANPIKLLKIKDWNFSWRQTYQLISPVKLPKGTVIHTLASYDNTTDNLCNPSEQPVPISWGAHMFSEMFFVHFEYISARDTEQGVLITAPSTVSSYSFPLTLDIKKKDEYRFSVSEVESQKVAFTYSQFFNTGKQGISLNISSLVNGNYFLEVFDSNDVLIAHWLFVKMREKGL